MDGPFAPLRDAEQPNSSSTTGDLTDAEKITISTRIFGEALTDGADPYLCGARGIPKPAGGWPSAVRFHPRMPSSFYVGLRRPALVMPKTDASGAMTGLHAVFLSTDGKSKADMGRKTKKSFGCGGAVVLRQPAETVLACEGPEDAITLYGADPAAGIVCTAGAGTLGRVADFITPQVNRVVLVADGDAPGRAAAEKVAAQLAGRVPVSIALPPDGIKDTNDLLRRDGIEGVRAMLAGAVPFVPPKVETPIAASTSTGDRGPGQREKLLSVVDRADFWEDADGDAYASVPVGDHVEHHPVRSRAFRTWLDITAGDAFPDAAGRPATFGRNALDDALIRCESLARRSKKVHPRRLRCAADGDAITIDLGGPDWGAVTLTAAGWKIGGRAAVPILRAKNAKPLPVPVLGGSVDELRPMVNADDDSFYLLVLFLLGALRPAGPYPILAISGEHGTGKSWLCRLIRLLSDPVGDGILQPPGDDKDLIAAARQNHVLAYDNISGLSSDLADSLCRVTTGADLGGRAYYTNNESASFSAQRPVVINGIPDLMNRGDLASRSLFIRLDPVEKRRTEAQLAKDFDRVSGRVFGALLTVLSAALARLPAVVLPDDASDLRLADFAALAIAAEPALGWTAGTALRLLKGNAAAATAALVELDPVATGIRALVEKEGGRLSLSVTGIMEQLPFVVPAETLKSREWPRSSRALATSLRRLAPSLRATGLDIEQKHGRAGTTFTIAIKDGYDAEGRGATAGFGDGSGDDVTEADFFRHRSVTGQRFDNTQ